MLWYVITCPCYHFKGGSDTTTLDLGYGWVITSYSFMWIKMLIMTVGNTNWWPVTGCFIWPYFPSGPFLGCPEQTITVMVSTFMILLYVLKYGFPASLCQHQRGTYIRCNCCWYNSINECIKKRNGLTHWGRDQMDAIRQTTFSRALSWRKMFEFWLKYHWSLFLRVQWTIFQHWFK